MYFLRFSFVLFTALLLVIPSKSWGASVAIEGQIIEDFQQEFDKIEAFAKKHSKPIDIQVLMGFIDKEVMNRWSAELTIRAILGKKLWASFNSVQKQAVIKAYSNTMKRYLYETFQKYNGQKPIADKVQLNEKMNKGWLTTRLVINNFPDISVDLKLYHYKNQWFIYDFRFQGISFVKLKQQEYRALVKEKGIQDLTDKLNKKYDEFQLQLGDVK